MVTKDTHAVILICMKEIYMLKKKSFIICARHVTLAMILITSPFVSVVLPTNTSPVAHAATSLTGAFNTIDLGTMLQTDIYANVKDSSTLAAAHSKILTKKPADVYNALDIYTKALIPTSVDQTALGNLLKNWALLKFPEVAYYGQPSDPTSLSWALSQFRSNPANIADFQRLFNNDVTIDDFLYLYSKIYQEHDQILNNYILKSYDYDQAIQIVVKSFLTLGSPNYDAQIVYLNTQIIDHLGFSLTDFFYGQSDMTTTLLGYTTEVSAESTLAQSMLAARDPQFLGQPTLVTDTSEHIDLTVMDQNHSPIHIGSALVWSATKNGIPTEQLDLVRSSATGVTLITQPDASGTYLLKATNEIGDLVVYKKEITVTSPAQVSPIPPFGETQPKPVLLPLSSTTSSPTADGHRQVHVTLNQSDIEAILKESTNLNGVSVQVPVLPGPKAAASEVTIPASAIASIKKKNNFAVLTIQSQEGILNLPLRLMDPTKLAKALGVASSDDVQINFLIKNEIDPWQVISKNHLHTIGTPVNFTVTATSNGKIQMIDPFTQYVQRFLPSPTDIDPNTVNAYTAIRLNSDGSFSPVPTFFTNGELTYMESTVMSLKNGSFAIVQHTAHFTDIKKKYWATDAVQTLGNKFIINGMPDGTFAPKKPVTRIQFVELLTRALGLIPNGTYQGQFKDVKTNASYAPDLQAALEKGLVQGEGDGTFAPNKPVTREEAAKMLDNAMTFTGYNPTFLQPWINLSHFSDTGTIASWANGDVQTLVEAGIFEGTTPKTFSPRAMTSRDQAAVLVYRYLKFIGYIN